MVDAGAAEGAGQAGKKGFDDGGDVDGAAAASDDPPPADRPVDDPPPRRRVANVTAPSSGEGDGSLGFQVRDDKGERASADPLPPGERDERTGFAERRERRDDGRTRDKRKRPPWESIVEGSVGVMVLNRTFDFNDPVRPQTPPNYNSGPTAAIVFDAAFYPLAPFVRNFLADIGIAGRYFRILNLKSELPPPDKRIAGTVGQAFEVGLRYRWNLLGTETSPQLRFSVEFGRQVFFILKDPPPLPNIGYTYLDLRLADIRWPFLAKGNWRFGVMAAFSYLVVFSSGDIENDDSTGYGKSQTGGIDVMGGIFAGYGGFFARLGFSYRRFFYNFDRECAIQGNCREAGGALEIYTGGFLRLGYAY